MSDSDIFEIFNVFDTYCTLLENPMISTEINLQNVIKVFKCGQFIETIVSKACKEGKEVLLENHIHNHWLQNKRTILYKYSDLEIACDKLLEVYLKHSAISTDVVDEFLKLYIEFCGSERLHKFFKYTIIDSVCTNIIIQSLEQIGVPLPQMEEEALIMSWEVDAGNGYLDEVSNNINKMLDNGCISKLIQLFSNLSADSKVKPLIMENLLKRIIQNDASICLAFANLNKKLLLKFLQNDSKFYINFLDTIFYFGRNMKQIQGNWSSDYKFTYDHLLKIIKILLDSPRSIRDITYSRLQIAKLQPNGTIWSEIEKDSEW